VQPEGPYLLGGFCNGGLLTYEIARQLEAAGQQVDFLGLINPTAPGGSNKPLKFVSRIGRLLHVKPETQAHWYIRTRHALRHVYRRVRPGDERLADFHKLTAIDSRLDRMFPPTEALYNDYVGVFSWLVSRYQVRDYPGKIDFYWAADEPIIQETWHKVPLMRDKKGIRHHQIPGTHMSCVTDHTQALAERLSESLHHTQEAALSRV
jgi:thioesterase domain-containing protein